jgi:uncharacterized repeat protein (TIGR02543 family)
MFEKTGGAEWLTVDLNGVIRGTPPAEGVSTATVTVSDGLNPAVAVTIQITVDAPLPPPPPYDTTPPSPNPLTWVFSPVKSVKGSVLGYYKKATVLNGWNEGRIILNSDGSMIWSNFAGAVWSLIPDYPNNRLLTGASCPYPGQNHTLQVVNGQVNGFVFNNETFTHIEEGAMQISMTAAVATDLNGVEYYFTETSGNPGGSDSGWQYSSIYVDDGLMTGYTYSYTVCARDMSPWANTTATSIVKQVVIPSSGNTFTLSVSSPCGTAIPSGVTTPDSNTLVNARVIDSPVVVGSTQYVCTGWVRTGSSPASGSGTNTSFTITNNTTITWTWAATTAKVYTVVFDEGAHGMRSSGGALTQYVVEGSAAVAPNITPDAGYTFTGWNAVFANVTSNMLITAQYAPIQYTLTYLAGPNGVISGLATQTLDYGASGTAVTAVPNGGYDFVAWSDSSTQNPRTDTGVTNNITVTATFASNVPPVVTNGAGAVSVSATSAMLQGVLTSGYATNMWFCWGMSDGGTNSMSDWSHVVSIGAVAEGGAFSNLVTDLSTNTTYFYRCYAENSYGSDWSDTVVIFSGTPVGGVAPWSPADITMAAWYDAADAGTITASANAVSQWRDKSGKANHLTGTGEPATGTRALNGLNVIDFDGANDQMAATSLSALTTANLSIFSVQQYDSVSVQSMTAFSLRRATQGEGMLNHSSYDAVFSLGYRYPQNLSVNYTENTNIELISYVKSGDTLQSGWINGVALTAQTGSVATYTPTILALGSRSTANYLNGFIGEFIISTTALSESDRQKIEGYLAHKWGLTNSLPASHPYKTTPPDGAGAVANLAPTAIAGSTATFNASLSALGTNRDVRVYYGTTDGGTNASSWASSAVVGSCTNVSTNISYAVSGLAGGTTYHYTFMASNAAGVVWGSPGWTFKTTGSAPEVTASHSVPYTWLGNWSWTNGYEVAVLDDPDGDGFATWQEYWSGTDPQNSNSFLKIESVTFEGGNIVIKWESSAVGAGVPPLGIQVRASLTSGSWLNVGQKSLANGVNAWSNSAAQQLYYRLAVTNAP